MSNIGSVMTINLRGGGNWRTSGLWYGYEIDLASSSKLPTRIGNSDLHRSLPLQNKIARYVENLDGTVNYFLHPNNSLVRWDNGLPAKLDGTDGNLMLLKPAYYFRAEVEGTKYRKMFSEVPLPGFTFKPEKAVSWVGGTFDNINDHAAAVCSLLFDDNGDIIRDGNGLPTFAANAAQYRGGSNNPALDGTITSQLGQTRTNVSNADASAKAAAIDAHIGVYRAYSELMNLMTLEYANYDSQEAFNPTLDENGFAQGGMGMGISVSSAEWHNFNRYYGFIPEGITAKLGNRTGIVDYVIKDWGGAGVDKTVQVSSWRGLEKPFLYNWLMCEDLLIHHQTDAQGGISRAYVCDDPALFAQPLSDTNPAVPAGYVERAQLPRASGYGLKETINLYGDTLISEIGGSANTGVCDYYYFPSPPDGWYQPFLAGSANDSTGGGPRYLRTNYSLSHAVAYIGFRLGRK